MIIHWRFLWREMLAARRQASIFILCVALSITSLVALNSFRSDVFRSITGDARGLHGGDLIVRSHYDLSPGLLAAAEALERQQVVKDRLRTWEFYTVVRHTATQETLFANILAVQPGYPLYGEVKLASGDPLARRLVPGSAIVAVNLLDRLGLKVGDSLSVGSMVLTIADVVVRESTRPVDVFNFGPRVFVAAADLKAINLIQPGSRVRYQLLLKIADGNQLEAAAATLEQATLADQERVSTYRNARSGLKRFFDNLLFFLSLISIFTLLLAGIGMQSSLAALLREKDRSLAIIKALGATQRFLVVHSMLLVLIYGLVGSLLGIGAGVVLKSFMPLLFAGIIPAENIVGLGLADIAEGMILGFVVVVFFTFLPLYRLREVKPNAIFRSESNRMPKGAVYYLAIAAGFLLLTLLVIHQLDDLKTGIAFMVGSTALIGVVGVLANLLLRLLARLNIRRLPIRQAVRSLLRPGNSTQPVLVTLASALSVLLAIFLVEHNLRATFIESYPADAPNLFLVDIQPGQRQGVLDLIGQEVELYPVVRARLKAINGLDVDRGERRGRFSDSLTREFSLTYRNQLLDDEVVIAGGPGLYRRAADGPIPLQVSILDTVAEMGDMELGDILHFNIQGVELKAEVTSIRSRNKSKLYPFFYFVFPTEYLAKAPQTLFAAIHVEQAKIAELENRVVADYPNISTINLAETAAELGLMMAKLVGIVNVFAGFSILAGTLIIVSSVLATRLARMREAVYYKVLGGTSSFVFSVFFYENLLLGLLSSLLAVLLAQAGSWALCSFVFEIAFRPYWTAAIMLIGLTIALVVAVGLFSSIKIIRQKPIVFLREQNNE
jgi:putative ABC transport system permease protein